jgi:bleomycin hydrolase
MYAPMRYFSFLFLSFQICNTTIAQETNPNPRYILRREGIASLPVEDQCNSSTCWVFGTTSLLGSELLKKSSDSVNFSEMFIARYAYIDKAKKYVQTGGKSYFDGGGQFHDVIRVVNRYGIVPESVYSGKLKKNTGHQHQKLDTAMQQVLHRLLGMGKTDLNKQDIAVLNDTLNKYLGKVPVDFIYRGKKYNPKTFAKKFASGINDFAELVSFANQNLYQKFVLADKYNWALDSFYNITVQDMVTITDSALHNGWSVGWEGDVTNSGFNFSVGYAAMDSLIPNLDSMRLVNYKNETTERDHMLHLVGTGLDNKNRKWYYLKNSWGTGNPFHGYLYMNENYFKTQTVILFVNKAAIPAALRKKLHL